MFFTYSVYQSVVMLSIEFCIVMLSIEFCIVMLSVILSDVMLRTIMPNVGINYVEWGQGKLTYMFSANANVLSVSAT